MRMILLAAPLLALGACETVDQNPYGGGPNDPSGYPQPYPEPYPQSYPPPYPQPYPSFPQPYPPYPQPYPPGGYQATAASYRAIGTEPFWDVEIGEQMVFTDRGTNLVVVEPTPPISPALNGRRYVGQRLRVDISMTPCSDNMSDRTYPETVTVTVDGRPYRGCGAPIGFYTQIGENGLPNPVSAGSAALARTEWRVSRINGRPVPLSGHYINFLPDRIEAKFGCNALGAGYSVQGEFVTAGALIATRMACADMSFETQGSNVLSQPMRFDLRDPRRLVLTNGAGTIEAIRSN